MITFILALNVISSVQKIKVLMVRRYCGMFFLCLTFSCVGVSVSATASSLSSSIIGLITYATRLDAVAWVFEGSKFSCQINHAVDDFGTAMFERKAGVSTRFFFAVAKPSNEIRQSRLDFSATAVASQ